MSSSASNLRQALAQDVKITRDELKVALSDGRTIAAPLTWYPRLFHGTRKERSEWRFIGGGTGIVIAAAITSNTKLAAAPGNVALPKRSVGLGRDSVVNVSQLLTLDKRFLNERAGRVSDAMLRQVEDRLRLVLTV